MVKPAAQPPNEKKAWLKTAGWLLPIAIIGFVLYFGLPPFIELDEEGNYVLSEKRRKDYEDKPRRSEEVEVYKLVATSPGLYRCLRCPGISAIQLQTGEVWKYGISRNGRQRYAKSFYQETKVEYITIVKTDILNAEKMEKQLIISYPLLPESQQRMKLHGIFLKRPPGNTKDQ